MLAHWTGVYWNGQELGFKIFQQAVRRLKTRFDNLVWMKLSELARYWAAKELTRIERNGGAIQFRAPFGCADFTVRFESKENWVPSLRVNQERRDLQEVNGPLKLTSGAWCQEGKSVSACFALPKGKSELTNAA